MFAQSWLLTLCIYKHGIKFNNHPLRRNCSNSLISRKAAQINRNFTYLFVSSVPYIMKSRRGENMKPWTLLPSTGPKKVFHKDSTNQPNLVQLNQCCIKCFFCHASNIIPINNSSFTPLPLFLHLQQKDHSTHTALW